LDIYNGNIYIIGDIYFFKSVKREYILSASRARNAIVVSAVIILIWLINIL